MQKNFIFQTLYLLFKRNINASDINLRILSNLTDARVHNYKGLRKDSSAISVFILACRNDFEELKKYTTLLKRSKVINLVIFMENNETNLTCLNESKENLFHLLKGVSILVKCGEHILIHEWCSISKNTQRKIQINERATWDPKRNPRFIRIGDALVTRDTEFIQGDSLRAVMIKVRLKAMNKVQFLLNEIPSKIENNVYASPGTQV